MKHPVRIAATAAALIASAAIASASAASAGAASDGTSAGKPTAAMRSDIILTAKQDTTIWHNLSAQRAQKTPSSFRAAVGADLPKAVPLHTFSRKVADNILTLAGMKYAKLNDRVLVVRMRDRKIESIITPASAKS